MKERVFLGSVQKDLAGERRAAGRRRAGQKPDKPGIIPLMRGPHPVGLSSVDATRAGLALLSRRLGAICFSRSHAVQGIGLSIREWLVLRSFHGNRPHYSDRRPTTHFTATHSNVSKSMNAGYVSALR